MGKDRSTHSIRMDRAKRSSEPWERGRKAPKIGNPRYTPCMVYSPHYGKKVKRYCLSGK